MDGNDNDSRNARRMEQDSKSLQGDEEEFLNRSRSNENVAGEHMNPHQQDAKMAEELLCVPTSTLPAPAGGILAAATPAVTKEVLQVEVELRLLEALEIYHPSKLQGIHRHFVLYGLMEYLDRRLNHHFTSDEILELLDRFYNLELLKPDKEGSELLSQEEDFLLPASILSIKELKYE